MPATKGADNSMRYLSGFAIIMIMMLGCAPKRGTGESSGSCRPQNLTVEGGDETLTIAWDPNCDKLISGYNIYISEQSLASHSSGDESRLSAEPFNSTPFSGDTEPGDGVEHFVAKRLENGKKYHVSVQTVLPDQTLARFSKEIVTACSPKGTIDLSIRYKSEKDGFSFDQVKTVRADELANDIYFYSKDGRDVLASPRRLDGFLRDNRFVVLKYRGDLRAVKNGLVQKSAQPGEQTVDITIGDWVLLKTEDNMFALIEVLGFSGSGDSRRVELFYSYSTIKGEMFF